MRNKSGGFSPPSHILLALLLFLLASFSFFLGAYMFRTPEARKQKIDEYKREILSKIKRRNLPGPRE
ncbi:hypothetical protein Thal_1508 [Thermocrinis albus DSM 14484]|uniref:Transmembrane protein n=1 Tax=Thermocrinis albus (strain DSM 14484 / JCM 11386 / HI 11/12) TaxID=638303 RepID=D3SN07_THEAH|nr:hypothetical protein Thal_1508 [Thermocrinis albus DSM 14484]